MKCPGQDTRNWRPGDIFDVECPQCGNSVEFFKDEVTRTCVKCECKIINPRLDFGCAGYCQFAEQCFDDLAPGLLERRNDLFKDRLAVEVKKMLVRDSKKIAHITNVARYAEEIAREEKVPPASIISAAYLHVLCEGEQALAGGRQTAEDILMKLGAGKLLTGKVLDIVDRFITGKHGSLSDAKVFSDAHHLALCEEKKPASDEGCSMTVDIQKQCVTDSGKRIMALFR